MFIITLFLLLINNTFSNAVHPVHVTVTNIEFIEKANKYEISIKIFQDDFENIIKQKYGIALNLGKETEYKDSKKIISRYIFEHFRLLHDNKDKTTKKLKLIDKKLSDLAVWLYFDYEKIGDFKNIQINNSLMTDLYFDQTNLLIFTYKKTQKAIKFSNDLIVEKFDIQK
jgi:hypothetical protein